MVAVQCQGGIIPAVHPSRWVHCRSPPLRGATELDKPRWVNHPVQNCVLGCHCVSVAPDTSASGTPSLHTVCGHSVFQRYMCSEDGYAASVGRQCSFLLLLVQQINVDGLNTNEHPTGDLYGHIRLNALEFQYCAGKTGDVVVRSWLHSALHQPPSVDIRGAGYFEATPSGGTRTDLRVLALRLPRYGVASG